MNARRLSQGIGTLFAVVALALSLSTVALSQTHSKKPPAKPKATPTPKPAAPAPDETPRISTIPISDDGQVAYWRGDGNALDDASKNPGRLTGGTSYAPAMNGRGFRFTGRDDSVRVEDSYSLRLTRSLSFNAWINVDQFNTPDEDKGFILFRGDDRPGLDPYGLWVASDQRLTFHIESTEHSAEISAPIPGRRFVMITATLDAYSGEMSLYENTVLVARAHTDVRPLGDLDPAQHPGVGIGNAAAIPDSGYRYPFHGVINNLRVYSRVLAPGEIHALYAECLSVPSPLPRHEGDN